MEKPPVAEAPEENLDHEEARIETIFKFNQSPRRNIKLLCDFFQTSQTPKEIAHLMRTVRGLLGSAIGDYLAREENEAILTQYFMDLDLKVSFIEAMRISLSGPMLLPGEAQQIDRVVQSFANCYMKQNPTSFSNHETPYVLAFALIMLNSDLHNHNISRHINQEQFIKNTRSALGAEAAVPDQYLVECFADIQQNQFRFIDTNNKFMSNVAPKLRGPMRKRTKRFASSWTWHYFVLTSASLYYFKNGVDTTQTPLGAIQLLDVDVTRTGPLQLTLKSKGKCIQYVKFKKGPQFVHGTTEMLLEAPEKSQMDKWYAWIKKSSMMTFEPAAITTLGSAVDTSDTMAQGLASDRSDSAIFKLEAEHENTKLIEQLHEKRKDQMNANANTHDNDEGAKSPGNENENKTENENENKNENKNENENENKNENENENQNENQNENKAQESS